MTLPKIDFLLGEEMRQIAADVASLVSDPELTVPVTYRNFLSTTFTPSTGAQTASYNDLSLRAIRNNLSTREVVASAGLYQMGDIRFTFDRATFGSVTPNREDRIVDGTETYEVKTWDTDPIVKLWRIVARLVS